MEKFKSGPLYELFYHLVIVSALGNLASILYKTQDGWITPLQTGIFLIYCLAIIQIWMCQICCSRFNNQNFFEKMVMAVNMIAVLFLSNSLEAGKGPSMILFGLIVAFALAVISLSWFDTGPAAAGNPKEARKCGWMILVSALLYALSSLIWLFTKNVMLTMLVQAAAAALGILLPGWFYLKAETISVEDLSQHFQMMTIATLGGLVESLAQWFYPGNFSLVTAASFLIVVLFFAAYIMNHHLIPDFRKPFWGLVFLYSHLVMIIGLTLISAAQPMVLKGIVNPEAFALLICIGLLLFYAGIFANSLFVPHSLWTQPEKLLIVLLLLAGSALMIYMDDNHFTLYMTFTLSFIIAAILYGKVKMDSIKVLK